MNSFVPIRENCKAKKGILKLMKSSWYKCARRQRYVVGFVVEKFTELDLTGFVCTSPELTTCACSSINPRDASCP